MSTEESTPDLTPSKKKGAARKVKKTKKAKKSSRSKAKDANGGNTAKYPRHTVERSLRIPRAIIEQNAGRECSEQEAANYVGVGLGGPFRVEISSGIGSCAKQASRPRLIK